MKVITISSMILRLAFILALILGIIFWINPALPAQSQAIKGVHMLLGITVVLCVWAIGLFHCLALPNAFDYGHRFRTYPLEI